MSTIFPGRHRHKQRQDLAVQYSVLFLRPTKSLKADCDTDFGQCLMHFKPTHNHCCNKDKLKILINILSEILEMATERRFDVYMTPKRRSVTLLSLILLI